ncbi:MAG: putative quinol monooxygenase [Eubacteriales bacterium]
MPVTLVFVDVKPENIEDFKNITLYNCEKSRKEEGNIRFDLLQSKDDPTKFTLYEHFRDKAAVDFHKTTEHYNKWAAAVESFMASPRKKSTNEPIE